MKASEPQASAARAKRAGRVGISVKLFYYLALFTLFVLMVVWLLQIGLLDYFYRQTKYLEMAESDRGLVRTVQTDPDLLQSVAEEYGTEYLMCVRVFRVQSDKAVQVANMDMSGNCLIHHISNDFLTYLYKQAVSEGGVYTRHFTPNEMTELEAFSRVSLPEIEDNESWRGDLWARAIRTEVNTLHVRLVNDADGREYIIILNSQMEPLSTTVTTLETQFWVIAALLLVGALLLSLLISHNISTPIRKMNLAAKRLAGGHYDADFEVRGYREVMELSDSLTHASEELSKNDRLQKELLANISHDLRTPLTMIVGYSEVMRDIPEENTPENVQVIIDETQRLSELVNDLLDLSKLQAGTRKLTPERFDLTDTVRGTMTRYEKLTQKDGYCIEFSYDGQAEVEADRTMILQVIYNLINNAVNYTGEDQLIRVTQQILPTGRVRISVTDSGAGIPPDQIPLIWDRYYKVDKVHRRAMVGTGLGLSIVKQILEQHETSYGVESKLGHGSTFWFELKMVGKE